MLSTKFFYVFLFSVALFIGIAALYLRKIDEKIFKPGKLKRRHRKLFE